LVDIIHPLSLKNLDKKDLKYIRKIYNFNFAKDKNLAKKINSLLGFVPANLYVFKLAFAHRSTFSNESPPYNQNNERLEYLGDAVLGQIVAEYLFNKYPLANEGFLTKMRSKIVNRKSLNSVGAKMELDLLLTQYNHTRISSSMLGNALEALIGAIYIDVGYKATRRIIIKKVLSCYLDIHHLETLDENYKSQLLEYCQKNGRLVTYSVLSKYKLDNRDRFKVAVMVDGKKVATADDYNKKSAEQSASHKALDSFGILGDIQAPS